MPLDPTDPPEDAAGSKQDHAQDHEHDHAQDHEHDHAQDRLGVGPDTEAIASLWAATGPSGDSGSPRLPPQEPVPALRIEVDPRLQAPLDEAHRRRVAAPPRPHARRPSGRVSGELLRALLFPGISTMRRAFVLGFLLFTIGVLAPVFVGGWVLVERGALAALALDDRFLLAVQVVGVAAVLSRFVAITEVAVFRGRFQAVGFTTFIAYVLLGVLAVPVAFGVWRVYEARELFADLFPDRPAVPLYVPPGGANDGFFTVLLLGSDAGEDRFGDRTDSMILVTVHRASGRTGLISIPRNLVGLRFPPGSAAAGRYPNGFGDLANAVYPVIDRDPALQDGPEIEGVPAAAIGVARAIGHSVAVQVDDVVFTDMVGFMEIVDVLGGVTVEVDGVIPLPPNIIGATDPIPPTVGPGAVHMNGSTAVAYARARYTDSDYARMGRQRQVLSALAAQTSVIEAVWRLPGVAEVLRTSVRTSLSQSSAADLVRALGDGSDIVESVGLVPPLITPSRPDWDRIRVVVTAVQDSLATGVPSGYTPVPEPTG